MKQLRSSIFLALIALFVLIVPVSSQEMTSTVLGSDGATSSENVEASEASSGDSGSADPSGVSDDSESVDESVFSLTDLIEVDEYLGSWEDRYTELIQSLGFDGGVVGQAIVSLVIVLLSFLLIRIFRLIIRYALSLIDEHVHILYLSQGRISLYKKVLGYFSAFVVLMISVTALAATWGFSVGDFFQSSTAQEIISTIAAGFFIVILGLLCSDMAVGFVEAVFRKWGSSSQSRLDTLLPIAKNTVYVIVATIFVLMFLSELGINVMPLLAGAGVIGFAIGFGAQTLVKDLLTGFIIIFEDLVQVGDVATLAGKTGLIEKITIRKIQMRNLEGIVFTVPFSEISIVENLTKDFSYAMFEIGIAYREGVDEVCAILKTLDEEFREDKNFSDDILEPLEIFGLDKFADSAIIIKARIKTKPIKQWGVMREFNRRIKLAFDRENIEIPFPHQTIYFGEDKSGDAPPLNLRRYKQIAEAKQSKNTNNDDKDNVNDLSDGSHKKTEQIADETTADKADEKSEDEGS